MTVDLLTQELGHDRVQTETLGELDHGRMERPQGVEERRIDLELLESPPRLGLPVVLDDGRHLAVVAHHDDLAVRPQRQGRHDRLGQVHLRGLVQHQAVDEVMAEDLLAAGIS